PVMKSLLVKAAPRLVWTMLAFIILSLPVVTLGGKPSEDKKKKDELAKRMEKLTAEQLAELVILAYGGRAELQQVRTNGVEDGLIRLPTDNKDIEGRIFRKFLRRDNGSDLLRVDVELPTQKLTFGYNGYTMWAARDGVNFTPTKEAEQGFLASLTHKYEALLRYKEQESTVTRCGSDCIVGIDTEMLDLIRKDGSKTRFYISTKTFRILHLEYELQVTADGPPTKYRESFYDFRPVQNTLVPTKQVLYENGRLVQEIRLTQIKYHDKLDEEIFLRF
ncbi:MAG: hypothetical protein AB1489_35420, partial [Acidobacteriota bacterium]